MLVYKENTQLKDYMALSFIEEWYIKLTIQCRHCHALIDNDRLNLDLIEKCPYCEGLLLETSTI